MTESTPALICSECGTRNEPGTDFCGNCGSYLAWDRTSLITVIPPKTPVPAPEPVAPDPPATVVAPVTPTPAASTPAASAPSEPTTPAAARTPAKPDAAVAEDAPTKIMPTIPPASAAKKAAARPSEAAAPPTEAAVAVEATQPPAAARPVEPELQPGPALVRPAAVAPELVQPAAPIPKPQPVAPAMEQAAAPGDILCSNCSYPNSPGRHFCERCGAVLSSTTARTDASAQPPAGTRPKKRRGGFPFRLLAVVLVLIILCVVAYLERAPLRTAVAGVLDHVAPQQPENPQGVGASSSAPGHSPLLAFDGLLNTTWEPQGAGSGVGQYLVATFPQPFRLVYLQIRAGDAQSEHTFLAQGRPSTILVTMTDSTGATTSQQISLADGPSDQQFLIGHDNVVKVQLTVLASQGTTATLPLAITEVEFRTR
jgi:hypothetical protein